MSSIGETTSSSSGSLLPISLGKKRDREETSTNSLSSKILKTSQNSQIHLTQRNINQLHSFTDEDQRQFISNTDFSQLSAEKIGELLQKAKDSSASLLIEKLLDVCMDYLVDFENYQPELDDKIELDAEEEEVFKFLYLKKMIKEYGPLKKEFSYCADQEISAIFLSNYLKYLTSLEKMIITFNGDLDYEALVKFNDDFLVNCFSEMRKLNHLEMVFISSQEESTLECFIEKVNQHPIQFERLKITIRQVDDTADHEAENCLKLLEKLNPVQYSTIIIETDADDIKREDYPFLIALPKENVILNP